MNENLEMIAFLFRMEIELGAAMSTVFFRLKTAANGSSIRKYINYAMTNVGNGAGF